jgi:hypothetical protein
MTNKDGGKSSGIPFFTYTILDVFDNSMALSCTDENVNESYCGVDVPGSDTVVGCAQCRSLAKELMSK